MSFNYKIENNILYYSGTEFTGSTQLTTLKYPPFQNNTTLTKVMPLEGGTVVTGITDMDSAFSGCTALYSADLSNFDESNTITANFLFHNCSNLVQASLPAQITHNNSWAMFENAGAAGSILDVYAKSIVTTAMFIRCNAGKIRVHGLTTDKCLVTNFAIMFENCPNLTVIDLSDTKNKNTLSTFTFKGFAKQCPNLVEVYYPEFLTNSWFIGDTTTFSESGDNTKTLTIHGNFAYVNTIEYFFAGGNYRAFNMDDVVFDNYINASYWYYNCDGLTTIDLSKYTFNNFTGMFQSCDNLTTVHAGKNLGSADSLFKNAGSNGGRLTLDGDFSGCDTLTSAFYGAGYTDYDFTNLIKPTAVLKIGAMFGNTKLKELDLSSWNFESVTKCNAFFNTSSTITKVILPKIPTLQTFFGNLQVPNITIEGDLSITTNFSSAFQNTELLSIDLTKCTPSKIISNMQNTFRSSDKLTYIDMSNFECTDECYFDMFINGCTNLTTLKMPKLGAQFIPYNDSYPPCWNGGAQGMTLKVYGDFSNVKFMASAFSGTLYSVLDLSGITPPLPENNVNLYYTFEGCSNLTTIYCENLYTGSTSQNVSNTFANCSTNLVGGNGTVWNSSNISGSYAVVDAEGSAGYFTKPIPEASLIINIDPAEACDVVVKESHQPIKSEFTWHVDITAKDGYIYNYAKMSDQPKLTISANSFYINRFEGGSYTLNIKATKVTKEYKENPKEYLDTLPSDDVPESTIGDNIKISDYGLYKLFIPTGWQLIQFINMLYDNNFIKTITELWASLLPLSDLIISAQLLPYKPEKSGETTVKVGWADSGVSMYYYDQQFATLDMGSVTVPRAWGNFLDYNPFTTVMIYLPFIGLKELENDDTIGKTLNLKYKIDLLSGDCVALIMIDNQVKAQFTGNCAYRIPLKENNLSQMALSGIKAAVGVAATVGAGAVMGPAATTLAGVSVAMGEDPVDAAQSIGDIGMAQYVISSGMKNFGSDAIQSAKQTYQNPTTRSVDNMGGNQAYCGVDTPYIIVGRSIPDMPDNFAELNGFTSNRQAYLYELKGYTEVYTLLTNSLTCTQNEKAEIESLLKKGVIL